MKILNKLTRYQEWNRVKKEYAAYSRHNPMYDYDLDFFQAMKEQDPNYIYAYMHHYFHQRLPKILREHREYFSKEGRGFGEDAFHAMWWLLFLSVKPRLMLEIGIYRGQTISLWSLISRYVNDPAEIHGVSPFTPLGDSVSTYTDKIDYYEDVINSFNYWKLKPPRLVRGLSTDLESIKHLRNYQWDLIYIDGSHDYEVVLADYRQCIDCLPKGGILVIDDASLGSEYKPPAFAFAGHPGPSRVARECAQKEMNFIGCVGHNNVFVKR